MWRQNRNVPFEQSRNVPLRQQQRARHSLVRHYLASRPTVKAALRRPRRGLTAPVRDAQSYSQMREWRALFWLFRARGDVSTLPTRGTFLLCRDTTPPRIDIERCTTLEFPQME